MEPLFKPYMPANVLDDLNEILYSGKLAFGKWGNKFESELCTYLGTANAIVVNSYSSAINITLSVLNIHQDDEIIMSPMCCLQSSQPLAAKGIRIIWADIDPTTGTLCPESVKKKITKRTKAIFHNQHLGYVGYIDEINQIGKEFGIFIIDDCVDGMGEVYKGKKVGNCGSDATVMSFHAVRLPNAIEGGAISFKNEEHTLKAKIARDLGIERNLFRNENGEINEKYDVSTVGYGATLNEINSYIAYRQMENFDMLLGKQRRNAEVWVEKILTNNTECIPLKLVPDSEPIFWVFGMLTSKKDEIIKFFRDKGYYASGVHLNNNRYSVFKTMEELPGVSDFYSKFVGIPSGWWLNKIEFAN
ncbi:MAG: aminotransferase DegT [Sphingobacteriales bacterium 41-5]|nr:MAG: aminotransferase DegT [Niabella sp. SCN 42-15]OJU28241.1 MAG: aminotransferase DegT [Sphingobacteriales bacterium 41-5]